MAGTSAHKVTDIISTVNCRIAIENLSPKTIWQTRCVSLDNVAIEEGLVSQAIVMDAVIHQNPSPPRFVDPEIPVDLETICLKAMEKTPARRYATAKEFADDLRRWMSSQPIKARRSVLATWRIRSIRDWLLIVGSAISVILVIGAIGVATKSPRSIGLSEQEVELLAQSAIQILHTKDVQTGLTKLTQAIEFNPKPEWLCERAYAKIRLNKIESALNDCERVLTKEPQHPRAHYLRYLALRNNRQFDEAYKELNIATILGDPIAKTEKRLLMKSKSQLIHKE